MGVSRPRSIAFVYSTQRVAFGGPRNIGSEDYQT